MYISVGDEIPNDEVTETIDDIAHRMGHEPYIFTDSENEPWAALIRYDEYQKLLEHSDNFKVIRAFASPTGVPARPPF